MTAPRPVVAGRCYLFTRRCTQRSFLLRPGERTNQAVLYCLAVAAEQYHVDICMLMAMSNHHHVVAIDRRGNYPDFLCQFHKLVAKVLNAHWGRWENLWATEQCSVVRLVDPADTFDKVIYGLTNPVKDHLVKHARDWPGATSVDHQLNGRELTVPRPHWFFSKDGEMPKKATLRFVRPPGFEHLTHAEWADKLTAAIEAVEHKAEQQRLQLGTRVLGRKGVLRQSAFSQPSTHAPRREMSPRIAAKNKWRRIEAIRRNVEFLEDYRAALQAYRAKEPGVRFPHGTFQLRREHDVCCHPPPPTASAA